jgi:hypothetical protein
MGTTDLRARVLPALLGVLLLPLLASSKTVASPSLDGLWEGTLKGTTYSQDTGEAPVKTSLFVSMSATQVGDDVACRFSIEGDAEYDISVTGRNGRGAFWAYNGDSAAPFMVLGKVTGKSPKLKIKGRAVLVDGASVSELTLSLRRIPSGLKGTVAAGAAVADAGILFKDRAGSSIQTTTRSDGTYDFDTTGFTPPFFVRLDLPGGGNLYGIAEQAGVANVHPLTDLIMRTWYAVEGTDIDAAFATFGPETPFPSPVEIDLLEGLVRRTFRKWLGDQGVDPDGFDLIGTSFLADGQGFDAVLDETVVAPDGSSLTVTDGVTTQNSDFSISGVSGSVTVDTSVSSPAGSSEYQDGTVVPASDEEQEAVAGALATMNFFRAKVNARGAALTASDLAGFLTADFLSEGDSRAWWTAGLASDLRGLTMSAVSLRSVASFDGGAGLVALDLVLSVSLGEASQTENLRMTFKKTGSAWLLYGNQEIAEVGVEVEYRTDYLPGSVDGPRKHVNVDIRAPVGTVQSVSITGGGIFDATDAPKDARTAITTVKPTPTTELDLVREVFFVGADPVDFPAPGTEFLVTVTPVSGSPKIYAVVAAGNTTETVSIVQPLGNSLATDAHPGTEFTGQWTLPTTFPIEKIKFSGHSFTTSFSCDVDTDGPLAQDATLGSFTFPTTCGGEATSTANFNLTFQGPNGERIMIIYEFE